MAKVQAPRQGGLDEFQRQTLRHYLLTSVDADPRSLV